MRHCIGVIESTSVVRDKTAVGATAPRRLANCRCASPGCARFLFSSCSVLLSTAIRAHTLGAGRAHFPLSACGLRESHGRQVVPGLLFLPVVYRKTGGIEGAGRNRDP